MRLLEWSNNREKRFTARKPYAQVVVRQRGLVFDRRREDEGYHDSVDPRKLMAVPMPYGTMHDPTVDDEVQV